MTMLQVADAAAESECVTREGCPIACALHDEPCGPDGIDTSVRWE